MDTNKPVQNFQKPTGADKATAIFLGIIVLLFAGLIFSLYEVHSRAQKIETLQSNCDQIKGQYNEQVKTTAAHDSVNAVAITGLKNTIAADSTRIAENRKDGAQVQAVAAKMMQELQPIINNLKK